MLEKPPRPSSDAAFPLGLRAAHAPPAHAVHLSRPLAQSQGQHFWSDPRASRVLRRTQGEEANPAPPCLPRCVCFEGVRDPQRLHILLGRNKVYRPEGGLLHLLSPL